MFAPVWAQLAPDSTALGRKAFRHPKLFINNHYQRVEALPSSWAAWAHEGLRDLELADGNGRLDRRTGRWGTLVLRQPILPGRGNRLAWPGGSRLSPKTYAQWQAVAWDGFMAFLQSRETWLRVDVNELIHAGSVVVHDDGELIQIHAKRQIGGVAVRDSFLSATINHGNLVLFGARNWGEKPLDDTTSLTETDAVALTVDYLQPLEMAGFWRESHLEWVPMATGSGFLSQPVGGGLSYRQVWVIHPRFERGRGSYQALVDAQDGSLLAFFDTAQYADHRIQVSGGVYPLTNTEEGPTSTQQMYPMPFADIHNDGQDYFTSGGGNLALCLDGTVSTTLTGLYVAIVENCGPILETSATGLLDLGVSGTNCETPPNASAGNTAAARTAFYHINKVMEAARAQLPNNPWLQGQLRVNVNINLTCGASGSGTELNFFREGNGCGNSGEIAGVLIHEWGHGMDTMDVSQASQRPGEAIADIYAALRLNQSCVGPGYLSSPCGGYGDPCIQCTGVRDIDWQARQSAQPHTVVFAAGCPPTNPGGPCGGSDHCESAVISEAIWDLWKRDLPQQMGLDENTAHLLVTRLVFRGSGPVGDAYGCADPTAPFNGCNGDGFYLNLLAADDDNGNLDDGTPHQSAIFAALNRHGVACDTPAP